MLGRGLESLIPNKNAAPQGQGGVPAHPAAPQHAPQYPQQAPAPQHVPQPPAAAHPAPAPHVPPPVPAPQYAPQLRPVEASRADVRFPEHEEIRHHRHEPETKEAVFHIEIEKIKPNPFQPRREFHAGELDELAQSIREFGILQPLVVSKVVKEAESGADVEYQLIAGERRLRAAKLANFRHVPAIVKQVGENRAKFELAIIENIQRSNLNPIESARAYARLQDEFGLTQREIATRMGKSREVVANAVRLLNLPTHMQDAVAHGAISESQGRALLAVSDPADQERMFSGFSEKKAVGKRGMAAHAAVGAKDPRQKFWESRLEEKFGAPVKIKRTGAGGAISIQYFSDEELQGLLERLG